MLLILSKELSERELLLLRGPLAAGTPAEDNKNTSNSELRLGRLVE